MIYWAPFLHFYQPSFQFHQVLKKIADQSYRPLIKVFLKHPQAKATVNICGSLSEMLYNHNGKDILDGIKKLARRRQWELVDSAKFHPILPLIPAKEARRQVKLNQQINRKIFGSLYQPAGFFPPEMAYSAKLFSSIRKLGYKWILLSGAAHRGIWPLDFISSISAKSSLRILFRDDIISNEISFRNLDSQAFINKIKEISRSRKNAYIITAMDAETFGHHIPAWENLFLAKTFESISSLSQKKLPQADSAPIKITTISELFKIFPLQQAPAPKPSSWSTTQKDIDEKNYYPLWKDPQNSLHSLQWQHLSLCWELVYFSQRLKTSDSQSKEFALIAREILDKALLSCQFWWANKNKNLWSVNLINKGLLLQEEAMLNAYQAVNLSGLSGAVKETAQEKYRQAQNICGQIKNLLRA